MRMKMVSTIISRTEYTCTSNPESKTRLYKNGYGDFIRGTVRFEGIKGVHHGREGKSRLFPMRQKGTGLSKVTWYIPCHPGNLK